MSSYNIAIVGATGAVGEEILRVLDEMNFPVKDILPLASAKSAGEKVEFRSKEYVVRELTDSTFDENEIDIAFFSAGGSISAHYVPFAAASGAVVIDNTSHFRMQENVPLVVPECNPQDIKLWEETSIIANPNCSTIQMVQILKPLDDAFDIERVDVSTYQATSGAGKEGMSELVGQLQQFFAFKLDECEPKVFPHQIAMNVIPHIDVFLDNDYTKEEMSEAITIKFKKDFEISRVREILRNAPSIVLVDDPSKNEYPMPLLSSDTNETYVGRLRRDNFDDKILHLWCSADQIRVGAATNAVRIALRWIDMQQDR